MRRFNIARLLAVGTATFIGATFINVASVHADALPSDATTQAATISAGCFDQPNGLAYWSVSNPNQTTSNLQWTTDDGDESGTYDAVPGTSQFTTPYDDNEPTESFIFSQDDQDDTTLVVPTTACVQAPVTPVAPVCVDGTNRDNLHFEWSDLGTVTVRTKHHAPLCDDVTVYFSSYSLPDTYDKTGIFDDSSIPQQLFASVSAVLLKGTSGEQTLAVDVPNACTSYQLDLYYAPEIVEVTGAGHGSQLIYGNITSSTVTDCTVQPGKGGGDTPPPVVTPPPVIPPVVSTPPVVTPAAPVGTLSDTGTEAWLTTALATLLLTTALGVQVYSRFSRGKNA
jgi:hypothetical protein